MTDPFAASCDASAPDICITCGDVGTPMRVLEVADGYADCIDAQEVRHSVLVDLIDPVRPGDGVLVHAGVAIASLDGTTP
jgi:hydrogenase maturation factor